MFREVISKVMLRDLYKSSPVPSRPSSVHYTPYFVYSYVLRFRHAVQLDFLRLSFLLV